MDDCRRDRIEVIHFALLFREDPSSVTRVAESTAFVFFMIANGLVALVSLLPIKRRVRTLQRRGVSQKVLQVAKNSPQL